MKFEHNPYYSPEKCGLEIFEKLDTAGSYEFDIICIWRKLDDNTLWWDSDAGCSCPSPFDNGDHGHDLKLITSDTLFNFEQAVDNHYNIKTAQVNELKSKVKKHLKCL